ncbi:hypothetical protein IGK30_001248 [Enterococcus sp. AZ178]|uniref:helix-turn-helix domain-containing protein n=1 Tax=Enterococcus TaxID=1350 RepID=UPI00324E3E76
MDHNQLLKKLRVERNFSQAALARNISNRNTLSSYEIEGTSIKFHILLQYLDKLNVSLEEFVFLSHAEKNEKHKIAEKLQKLYYNQKFNSLNNYVDELEKLYNSNNDFYYFHLISQYKLALDKLNISPLSNTEKKNLKKQFQYYLDKVETWGRFESTIFINVMYLFETDYICFTLKSIEKKFETYRQLFQKYQLIEKMYINSLILFAERREIQLMEQTLISFTEYISSDDLKSKVLILFFEGYIYKDRNKMDDALEILKRFDLDFHHDFLSTLLEKRDILEG